MRQLPVRLLAAVLIFAYMMNLLCPASEASQYVKACWISYLDFEVYLKDKSEAEFRENVSAMYDRLLNYGINTVIVQVRPMGDAIYPSEYFPVSRYISESRQLTEYDPLLLMIEEAHNRSLSFEAWINPYRLSRSDETTADYQTLEEYSKYKDFIYSYTNPDGEECLSLEPSDQRSVSLIAAGVAEVVTNYDVDGIHFDDYFYVDGMHEDTVSEGERMNYVNSMISQVYETVKNCDSECTFGVSPAGNIDGARSQGADIDRWLSTPGYVDYIMPQIYWTDYYESHGETVTMFSDMAESWQEVNVLNLPIYVGLALYRAGEEASSDLGWSMYSDNLARSWQKALDMGYDGYALFRYEWFDMPEAEAELENLKEISSADEVGRIVDEISRLALKIAKKHLQ
jgi:uncharacterized lipoprotein YddW (UPF0748 family)